MRSRCAATEKRMSAAARLAAATIALSLVPTLFDRCSHQKSASPTGSAPVALLVTAHPDDESMFFGPTLRGLREMGHDMYLLSLTTGDSQGLGPVRSRELDAAAREWGVSEAVALDHPTFRDALSVWDITAASAAVVSYASRIRRRLSIVVTFDWNGISHHPDHRHAHEAVMAAAHSLTRLGRNVKILQLQSQARPFAFSGALGVAFRRIGLSALFNSADRPAPVHIFHQWSSANVYRSMQRHHRSQWRWFRVIHVLLSRYSYINELEDMLTPSASIF